MTRKDRLALKHITPLEQKRSTLGLWIVYFNIAIFAIPSTLGTWWFLGACIVTFIGLDVIRDQILLYIDEKRAEEAPPELPRDDDSSD